MLAPLALDGRVGARLGSERGDGQVRVPLELPSAHRLVPALRAELLHGVDERGERRHLEELLHDAEEGARPDEVRPHVERVERLHLLGDAHD